VSHGTWPATLPRVRQIGFAARCGTGIGIPRQVGDNLASRRFVGPDDLTIEHRPRRSGNAARLEDETTAHLIDAVMPTEFLAGEDDPPDA
jgi:hypothetical protein